MGPSVEPVNEANTFFIADILTCVFNTIHYGRIPFSGGLGMVSATSLGNVMELSHRYQFLL